MDHIFDMAIKNFTEISGYIFVALSFVLLTMVKNWFSKAKFFDAARMINYNSKIRDLLVELRTVQNADRAKLFQFHNGEYFVSGESVMKFSLTHVAMKTGISFPELSASYVSVPTGYLTRTLEALQTDGVHKIVTEESEDDFFLKHIFVAEGIQYCLMAPVMDNKGHWVGFVMCVWLNESRPKNSYTELEHYAAKIGSALGKK